MDTSKRSFLERTNRSLNLAESISPESSLPLSNKARLTKYFVDNSGGKSRGRSSNTLLNTPNDNIWEAIECVFSPLSILDISMPTLSLDIPDRNSSDDKIPFLSESSISLMPILPPSRNLNARSTLKPSSLNLSLASPTDFRTPDSKSFNPP